MNVTFQCPNCDGSASVELADGARGAGCPKCGRVLAFPDGAVVDGRLTRCLVCPSEELFVRKDFPQRLGVSIVVAGLAASCVAWHFYWIYVAFGFLLATAVVDLVLYWVVGQALVCYRCNAHYRQVAGLETHAPFRLETHERYRQQAARLAEGAEKR